MATDKTTSAAQAPDQRKRNLPFGFVDVLNDVDRQLALIQWIESARNTLGQLWSQASDDKDLSAVLDKNDVRMGIEWSETESSALQDMFLEIRVRMGKLQSDSEQGASHV